LAAHIASTGKTNTQWLADRPTVFNLLAYHVTATAFPTQAALATAGKFTNQLQQVVNVAQRWAHGCWLALLLAALQ
jgi:hypothetical protein